MVKRKNQPVIDTDSESDGSDGSLDDMGASKKKGGNRLASTSPRKSSDDSSGSESEEDTRVAKKSRRMTHSSDSEEETNIQESEKKDEIEKEKSDMEEGQLSSDDEEDENSESSSSSDSEFSDGYDENLMGDESDRARLEALTEKEREQEIFKRIEERERKKTRWEIERKLKLAKRAKDKSSGIKKPKEKKKKKGEAKRKAAEKPVSKSVPIQQPQSFSISQGSSDNSSAAPQIYSSSQGETDPGNTSDQFKDDYFDVKERSKERKKNVEANKTDDKRSSAMALLKAKREGKQKREEEEAKREAQKKIEDEKEELEGMTGSKSSVKLRASDVYSDDSSSDSEEKRSDNERRSSSTSRSSSDSEEDAKSTKSESDKKPVEITTCEDLNKLRISRHKLEKFVHLPVFEKTILGCFVRINIGNNNMTGKLVYRAAEIIAVVETPKIYQFGSSRTNKGLRLKHGPQERIFRLEFVSNSDFTDSEFEKWRSMCLQYDCEMPTMDRIQAKQKDIQTALNYEFKEEDIDRIVEEKNRFRAHPTNYAMKKTSLIKERDAAILRGEHSLAKEINNQIQELEQRANELDKKRSSNLTLISYINDRNRKKNVEEAEKAIKEEMRASKGVKYSDPFTRRSTKPTMAFKASRSDDPIIMAPEPPKIHYKQKETSKDEGNSSDVYSLHNFDIDLDVALPINNVQVLPKPMEKVQTSGPKRSLNLQDYKKKRGLI